MCTVVGLTHFQNKPPRKRDEPMKMQYIVCQIHQKDPVKNRNQLQQVHLVKENIVQGLSGWNTIVYGPLKATLGKPAS